MNRNAILIVGSGAVASTFAARLAMAGVDVAMLATWEEGIKAICEKGVRIQVPGEAEQVVQVPITRDPAELGCVYHAIVLVKAPQTQRAANQLKTCLVEDGVALTLQNGFGNLEVLWDTLGSQRSAAGVIVLGASLVSPGVVRATKNAEVKLEDDPRLETIVSALRKSGFSVDVVPNLLSLQWGKLLVNAAINPLSALLQVQNGALLENRHAYALLKELVNEAEATALACGVEIPFDDTLAYTEEVIRKTASNFSSMLQDRMRNSLTEIEAITGSLVRFAHEAGVSVPVNHCMYHLVTAIEPEAIAQK